ncbi:hypothetical protein FACS1894104_5680 [Actinomycetota bacterium]|nr:hypothetical protein FACS1894104_5680 [Actinomycetota bacterium]
MSKKTEGIEPEDYDYKESPSSYVPWKRNKFASTIEKLVGKHIDVGGF